MGIGFRSPFGAGGGGNHQEKPAQDNTSIPPSSSTPSHSDNEAPTKYNEKSSATQENGQTQIATATDGHPAAGGVIVEGDATQLQRGLSGRHLNFIAIGGTIGTGFFLGSGTALSKAGPAGCLISYVFVGTILWSVMVTLGEMATFIPTAGAFSAYATRFVDPSLGFAMGWLYWFSWAITYALSLTASGLIIQYWNADFNIGIIIAIFWVVFTAVNYLPVRMYGELEMWLSSLKVITIVGFIIFGICVAAGVGAEGTLGFRYWRDPGPFAAYIEEGGTGMFVGFWAVLIQASFAYQGAELVGVGAGEARDPRKTVPRAIRTTFWGIMFLFVASIFLIGMLVPSDDPGLLTESSNASASPLVIAATRAGVRVLPDIINAVLLTAVLSAANSNVYSGSRILVALADEGQAWSVFKKTDKNGTPVVAVAVTSAFGLLGFLNLSSDGGKVFTWFLNISGVAGLITWATTCLAYLGFLRAMRVQGLDRDVLPYRSMWQPYTAIYGLCANVLIALTQGFTSFMPWNTADFFAAYISLILFVILWAGHKLVRRTGLVKPEDVDLVRGRLTCESDREEA
ncbi:amino acid permease/ SLC12A domain-containing protein [Echria macrotheca]|uniref:Amino acid permease/ SLC12A domain-containing protein n=1 Tax=Echria macrotheca TaxID=438768 RepID=A0AAJ0BMZ3_9PEZI|nr:amino acid permease/ SLC12A domain-containing protein [Echria macrotheca]